MTGFDSAFLGVYWGGRADPFEDHVLRLKEHFLFLSTLGAEYRAWKMKGRSRKASNVLVDTVSADALSDLLCSGVNRRDDNREPIPDLGFYISLWNGSSASTSVRCGMYAPGVSAKNLATLEVSSSGAFLLDEKEALRRLAEIWGARSGYIEMIKGGEKLSCPL